MSVEMYTPQEISGTDIFNQRLAEKLKVHRFDPQNDKLSYPKWFEEMEKYRQFHQAFLQYLVNFKIDAEHQDFLKLLKDYVENYHYLVKFSLSEIHYSTSIQAIIDYYINHPQKEILKAILKKIKIFLIHDLKEHSFYLPAEGFGQNGILGAVIELDHIQIIQKVCQENLMNFPPELKEAFYTLVDLKYDVGETAEQHQINQSKRLVCKATIQEQSEHYFSEIVYFNALVYQEIQNEKLAYEAHTGFIWASNNDVEKEISFILEKIINEDDQRLYQSKTLLHLLRYFIEIAQSAVISRFNFVNIIVKYIPKAYKKNELSAELIAEIEHHVDLVKLGFSSPFPAKKTEQTQQKIMAIVAEFKQKQTLDQTGKSENQFLLEHYQLPFSDAVAQVGAFIGIETRKVQWTKILQAEFDALQGQEKADWLALWQHIDSTTAKKPTQKWLKEAEKIFNTSVKNIYQDNLIRWVDLMIKQSPKDTRPFDSKNENTIKGLLWFGLFLQTQQNEFLELVSKLAQFCYRKIYGVGAASAVIGNICLFILSKKGFEGLGKLSFLQKKIRYELGQKVIRQALNDAAQENNLTTEQLKDVVCEDFEFEQAKLTQVTQWTDYDLVLQCMGDKRCDIAIYETQTQQRINKEPKGFKTASVVKDLKKQAKLVSDVLNVESLRLEEAMISQRHWSYDFWQIYPN